MTLSIVVPTKNRPVELRTFLASLWVQDLLPNQIIIIDQSETFNVIKDEVQKKADAFNITLNYVHDQNINGLVQAKAASISYNQCDLISFFDDDIVLERDYLSEVEKAFTNDINIKAANGFILNAPYESLFRRMIFQLTHTGIYSDNRREVLYKLQKKEINKENLPVPLDTLSGGLTTFRKEIFNEVPFDEKNRFHAYEDKEHSVRFGFHYSNAMYLIPTARLYHYHAASNRSSDLKRTRNDNLEVIKMFKKFKKQSFFGIDLFLLLVGLLLNAFYKMIRLRDFQYIIEYFAGLKAGIDFKIEH